MGRTLEEQRQAVLGAGKKYRRPVQYEKHRILINSALLVAVLIAVLVGWLYLSLYRFNTSSDVVYNITRLLPFHVATVEGEPVRYSDYLMQYRSSLQVIERQEGIPDGEDGVALRAHFRRASLDNAEMNAYAVKLGREMGLSVTSEQEDALLLEHRLGGSVSEESFTRMVRDNYGLSMNEYRRLFIHLPLQRRVVAVQLDEVARNTVATLKERIASDGSNFETIAEEVPEGVVVESSGGLIDIWTADGGRAAVASQLEVGAASESFLASDGSGYYFVKLLEKAAAEVSYLSIFVPLTAFEQAFNEVKERGGIDERIQI